MKNAIVSYEPIEKLVREATSNDPWGAKSTLMAEIALATNDHTQYNKLFAMLWKRLNDDANVLHVQKSMILIEYLLRNGSVRFIRDVRNKIDDISDKKSYQARGSTQEDKTRARQVRTKAAALIALVSDDRRLQRERVVADRIKGVKNEAVSNQTSGPSGGDDFDTQSESKSRPGGSAAAQAKKEVKDAGGDPFDQEFADDPFAAPKKKKPADPFDQTFEADPFGDSDPFATSKPKSKPAPARADAFSAGSDPFDSAPQPKKAPAKKAPSAEAAPVSGIPDIFNEVSAAPAPAKPAASTTENILDVFNGGGAAVQATGGAQNGTSADPYAGFAQTGSTEKKTAGFGGVMVNMDDIMKEPAQPKPAKKSMNQLKEDVIDVFSGMAGGGTTKAPPQVKKQGSISDIFFDQKQAAFQGMVEPQRPVQPQPAFNPYTAPAARGPYPGAATNPFLQQQQAMFASAQNPYAQNPYAQNPYATRQQPQPGYGGMPQMPAGYGGPAGGGGNPFLMSTQPASAPAPQPKKPAKPAKDEFEGLAW